MNAQSLADRLKDISDGMATERYGRVHVLEKLASIAEELRRAARTTPGAHITSKELEEILAEVKHMWAALIDVARQVPGAAEIVEPRASLPQVVGMVFDQAALAAALDPHRRAAALEWAVQTFGDIAADKQERAMRFVEEAAELVNAIGLPQESVLAIVTHVYGRQKGDRAREVGQAMLTLELLSEVLGIDPQRMAAAEFARVQDIPKEDWQLRHKAKVDIGIAK